MKIVFLSLLFTFLLKLLASALQCCVSMHCSLPHNPYCCLLPSHKMCMLYLVICTYFNSSTIAPVLHLHNVFVLFLYVMLLLLLFIGVIEPYWTIVIHYPQPDILYWRLSCPIPTVSFHA